KRRRGQFGAVKLAIWFDDRRAKTLDQLQVNFLAGTVEFMRDGVSVGNASTQIGKHAGDRGFAAGNSAGEAYAQHRLAPNLPVVWALALLWAPAHLARLYRVCHEHG